MSRRESSFWMGLFAGLSLAGVAAIVFRPAPVPWQSIDMPFEVNGPGTIGCRVGEHIDATGATTVLAMRVDDKRSVSCWWKRDVRADALQLDSSGTIPSKPQIVDLRAGGVDQDGNVQPLLVDRQGYLMVAVERREELERIARYLDGKNVVLLYRDKDGLFRHWKPKKCAP